MKLTKGFVLECRKVNVLRDFLCQAMDQVDQLEEAQRWRKFSEEKPEDGKKNATPTTSGAWRWRCGAVKKWADIATPYGKSVWYNKWQKRWLSLANKFKEANL